ncbi:serine/threonine protein kinase [Minicystis rosea]|nr:serine/threonine protein kinase [Minicystis rosea]
MLKPGDTLERYTIDAVLGQGGMGTVYRAHDTRLDRRVAIKVITEGAAPDSADARLLREARAAAALDHPNAVSIFDVGEVGGAPYIVMELVTGRTLRDAIGSTSTPVSVRVTWLADVARALSVAHRKGLVHRDIKPENVMVRDDGVVKVLDFGIARRAQGASDPSAPTQATALPTLTKEGIKVGTPLYMAPEQIRSAPLDGRVDQFAWGVVAFELLTGKLPWRATDPLAAVASILTDEPSGAELDAAGVPPDVKGVVLRALAKKPDDRFASMDDIVRALDPAAKSEVSSGHPVRISVRPPSSAPPPSPMGPTAASTTLLQRYSTAEVREILERAVERQNRDDDTRLRFDDLLAAAREVGVDEPTLREASRDLRARAEIDAGFEQWRQRRIRGFYRHVWVYVAVNIPFLVLALYELSGGPLMPALWWAIGLGIHAMKAFTAHQDDYRDELEKKAKKERKWRRREAAVERAIDEGAALLLKTGASHRKRFEPAQGRARIASDTAMAEAEAEAAAIAEDARARRRR